MHAKKLNLKEKCKKIKKVVTAVTLMGAIVVSQPGLVQAAASLTGANSTSGTMGNYKVGGNVSLRAHVASATTYVDNSGTGNLYVKLRYEYANNGTIYYINGEKTVTAPTYTLTLEDPRYNSVNKGARSKHSVSVGNYSWEDGWIKVAGSVFSNNAVKDN